MEHWQLKQLQGLPLEIKIQKSLLRIREWYDHFEGEVYVSFSGGKDSTVLLELVRSIYPEVVGVFVDTGLEYPEIKEFVKTYNNVITIKPKMSFKQVLDKYGFPVISKEQSQYIDQWRKAKSPKTKDTRWNGNKWGMGKISEKWKPLALSNIPISEQCCDIMKKKPFKLYEKETELHPLIGTMAVESLHRNKNWVKYGCNAFELDRPTSRPLSFWTEQDVLNYLIINNLDIAKVYGEIVQIPHSKKLYLSKASRTGCMFCMFGCHLEKEPNRFQQMYHTHPKIWDYCINKLDLKTPLDFIGVDYKPSKQVKFNLKGKK